MAWFQASIARGVQNVEHLTINAIHITATIDGKSVDIRGGATLGDDWYDEDHRIFAAGMDALDRMLIAKGAKPGY